VLLWNQFGRVEDARELIRAGAPVTYDALSERAARGGGHACQQRLGARRSVVRARESRLGS
jgi:hypothetical protein